ncbi:hypothetical protein TcG_11088 [Trypanosoma cruzi]|nr:hypothetical protein TcG_11088 [Trypanosoma cruzi]
MCVCHFRHTVRCFSLSFSSCGEAGFLCGFDALHAGFRALQRVAIHSSFLLSRLSFCQVFVPGVGGQAPGFVRPHVASRAFTECFFLGYRLRLCSGACVCWKVIPLSLGQRIHRACTGTGWMQPDRHIHGDAPFVLRCCTACGSAGEQL